MSDRIQIAAIVISVLLLGVVVELVRRRRLSDEYAITWLVCAIALLVLSIFRRFLDTAARWLGVYYPPAVLLLALIALVFVAALNFSVVLSRQKRQIEMLLEDVAVLAAELRDLQQRSTDDKRL